MNGGKLTKFGIEDPYSKLGLWFDMNDLYVGRLHMDEHVLTFLFTSENNKFLFKSVHL